MASGKIYLLEGEKSLSEEMENSFYIALWRDEMSDEKHEETHRLSSCLIEKNPTVFEPLQFSTNSESNHFNVAR